MDMELLVQKITEEVVRKLTGETGSTVAAAAPKGNSVLGAIDHTLLKPDATVEQVKKVCDEAKEHKFASVCVNPSYIGYVAQQLQGTSVKPCVVIGFPLGATMPEVKAYETKACIAQGAKEVDMVINIGAAKTGHWSLVQKDIEEVVNAARGKALVKVIIETCLLTDEEKIKACELAKKANADFVKTSTGFGSGGATVEDVRLMKRTVGENMRVKASTGINDRKTCDQMLAAGAVRMGTSKGILIVKGD